MELEEEIVDYCVCLHEWNASYEEYAKSVGLSYTSLNVLSSIAHTENCTQKMLCESCFLPKQTVNAIVTSFYKKGWLRMEELPEDRRNKILRFTPEGRAAADRLLDRPRKSEWCAMESLTEEERQALLSLTKRYVAACKQAMKEL